MKTHSRQTAQIDTVATPAGDLRVNKAVLLLLAVCLGGLGTHRYYLRRYGSGLLFSLLFWTPLPWLLGWRDALGYARLGEAALRQRYRQRLAGTWLCLVQVAGLLPAFALGAVAVGAGLPAYYTALDRGRVETMLAALAPLRHAVTAYRQHHGVYPPGLTALEADMGWAGRTPLPVDNPYLGSLAVLPAGRLEVVFNDRAASLAGQSLVLTPHLPVAAALGPIVPGWRQNTTRPPGQRLGQRLAQRDTTQREPLVHTAAVHWDCLGGTLNVRYRPPACTRPSDDVFR